MAFIYLGNMNHIDFLNRFQVAGTLGHYRIGSPQHGEWITSSDIPFIPKDKDVYFTPARLSVPFKDKSSFVGSKFIWVDRDVISEPMIIIPPTFIVSSGTGQHIYWELDDIVDVVTLERLNAIMIASVKGSDNALVPCTTILRVPDTINTKYNPPRPVKIKSITNNTYKPTFIAKLQNISAKTFHKVVTGDSRGYDSRSERDWAVIRELMVANFSYDEILFLYQHNKIGDKLIEDGGTKYFERTYKTLLESLETEEEKKPTKKVAFSVDEVNMCYMYGTVPLSTFIFELIRVIQQPDGGMLLHLKIKTKRNEYEVVLPKIAFNNVREFDRQCKQIDVQWLGSEQKLRQLLAILTYDELKITYGVKQMGLHKSPTTNEWTYIFERAKDKDGITLLNAPYSPTVVTDSITAEEEAKEILKLFLTLNSETTTWTVLSWYIGALAKPYLEQNRYRYPILQITGTTGTGKTTTINTLQRLLSVDPITYDANTTNFVMLNLFGSTNVIPIAMSEHRSHSGLQEFTRLILLSYDNGHNARGRMDLSVEDFPLSAPICVDGEDTFNDAAAIQRTVICVFNDKNKNPVNLEQINKPIGCLNIITTKVLEWINSGKLLNTIKYYNELLGKTKGIPDRPLRNHAIIAAVGHLLAEWLGITMPNKFWSYSLTAVLPNGKARLLIDDFITDVVNSIPTEQAKFHFGIYSATKLAFQLSTAHNWWMSRQRTRGGTILDIAAIRRQLIEMPYYEGEVRYRNTLCYLIDIGLAYEYGLDVPKEFKEN